MVDYRKFAINSDFPTDDIVYSYQGNLSGDTWSQSATISHGLPFIPLVFGIYSVDNGTTWSQINFQSDAGAGVLEADSNNVHVQIVDNNGLLPSSAIKVRIFGFAPSTYTGNTTPPTALSKFMIDSRVVYDELLASGVFQLANTTSPQIIYTHNLGYIPRVMAWYEIETGGVKIISPINTGVYAPTEYYTVWEYLEVTPSVVQFLEYISYGTTLRKVHYRIYGGQNA